MRIVCRKGKSTPYREVWRGAEVRARRDCSGPWHRVLWGMLEQSTELVDG